MKSASSPLIALLNGSDPFLKADLYTWTMIDGSVLRTTDCDVGLVANGHTFPSDNPSMSRTKVTTNIGVEVDSIDITIMPYDAQTIFGMSWQAAARLGYFDGAQVLVETAYIQSGAVVGTLHVFQGQISDVVPERTMITATVKSPLELLAQNFPRNVYQSICLHTVYDAGCGVTKASFTTTGTVGSGSTQTLVKTAAPSPTDFYDQGVITFTSGANNGLRRTVKAYGGTGYGLILPLPVAPASGDTFSIFAGCDKTLATCRSKFSNPSNFRGFPWIPNPETAAPPIPGGTTKTGK